MSFALLDDRFDEDPALDACDDHAVAAFARGLSYSARNLTDGFIAEHRITQLCRGKRVKQTRDQLVARELWIEVTGGVVYRSWSKYNPPAERVKEKRAVAAERQRRFRETRRTANGTLARHAPRNA